MRYPALWALIITVLAVPAGAQRKPRKPVVPPSAAYTITTSAQDMESLRAETRLAQFIRALQRGRRQKAAELLSSKVTPQARQDLIARRWLPAKVGVTGDFSQLIYWRDLQIRTQRIRGERRDLVVGPRRIPFATKKKQSRPTGILEVPMVREGGQWWVDLRPGRK